MIFAEELLRNALSKAVAAGDETNIELLMGKLRRFELTETESVQTTVIHGPESEIEKLEEQIAAAKVRIAHAYEVIASNEAEIQAARQAIQVQATLLARRIAEWDRQQRLAQVRV
jgi:hypothetical protein